MDRACQGLYYCCLPAWDGLGDLRKGGGKEGCREGGRKGEGGREGEREGKKERGREGGGEEGRKGERMGGGGREGNTFINACTGKTSHLHNICCLTL